MAVDNLFVADPAQILAGGGATDEIGRMISEAAKAYSDATSFDPQDPPWGDDNFGKQFEQNYVGPHDEFRAAFIEFANGVLSAANLTIVSAQNFSKTQSDIIGKLNGGRH